MSQHPIASPSPLAGEIAVVIGELVTAQANTMHAVARLAMLTRDLVEGTALQSGDAALRQEIASIAERMSTPRSAPTRTYADQAKRREAVLELYATTDLSVSDIGRQAGVDPASPTKMIRRARAAGDRRAAQGDLRRQQSAADQAAPLQAFPSAPHDGLPEHGGNASPERPEETGATGCKPAQGGEVVPAPDRGEELTTSDDPRPAPEPVIVGIDLGSGPDRIGVHPPEARPSVLEDLRAANKRITLSDRAKASIERMRQRDTEMEFADELDPEPPPRRAEPEVSRGPAGLAQRAAARMERPTEQAKPATKAVPLTEAEVGLPILRVDRKASKVIGPLGSWGGCSTIVLDVMARLADGNLYGQPVLQKLAGFNRPETFNTVLKRWKEELQGIGVELFVGPAGVRLQRQEIV